MENISKENKHGNIAMLIKVMIIIFIFLNMTGCSMFRKEKVQFDVFKNINIKYSGWDGTASATITHNDINYAGNDETIIKLLNNISYKIQPNKNLKNGDVIEVAIQYPNDLKKVSNVSFKEEKKKFKVEGLLKRDITVTQKETGTHKVHDQEVTDIEQYEVIDGVEIPRSWNLSEEDKQEYVKYSKDIDSGTMETEEIPKEEIWSQGQSKEKTHRKKAVFYIKDYTNNALTTYNEAYKYGDSSSQKFKVNPVYKKKDELIGYECIFEEENE